MRISRSASSKWLCSPQPLRLMVFPRCSVGVVTLVLAAVSCINAGTVHKAAKGVFVGLFVNGQLALAALRYPLDSWKARSSSVIGCCCCTWSSPAMTLARVGFLPTGFSGEMSGSGASWVSWSHSCWSLASMVSTVRPWWTLVWQV